MLKSNFAKISFLLEAGLFDTLLEVSSVPKLLNEVHKLFSPFRVHFLICKIKGLDWTGSQLPESKSQYALSLMNFVNLLSPLLALGLSFPNLNSIQNMDKGDSSYSQLCHCCRSLFYITLNSKICCCSGCVNQLYQNLQVFQSITRERINLDCC